MKNTLILLGLVLSLGFTACAPKDDDDNNSSPEALLVPSSAEPVPGEPAAEPVAEQPPVQNPPTAQPTPAPAPEPSNPQIPPEEVETPQWKDPFLNVNLLEYQPREIYGMTAREIKAKNDKTIRQLYATKIPVKKPRGDRPGRVTEVPPEVAARLIQTIDEHPVVAYYAKAKYDQPGTEIGYCFGRATYVHLSLLKLGVAKESIRKVWLVGPMISSNIQWAFHVAVAVKTTNGQWMVIDNFTGRLLEISAWVDNFYPFNEKWKTLRVYITSPSKFTAGLGEYSRVQLGLDLPANKDWYRHYFFDLMNWFQDNDMSVFGLKDLRYIQKQAVPRALDPNVVYH